jgi:probable addiction module antidote protein
VSINNKTRPYREALLEALLDPEEAANYLNVALEDSPEMFRKACLNVIQARQVAKVAKKAGVTRENLYRSFSAAGNPTLETLHAVLEAIGLHLGVQAKVEIRTGTSKKPASKRAHARTKGNRSSVPRRSMAS